MSGGKGKYTEENRAKWNALIAEQFKDFPITLVHHERKGHTLLHYQPGIEFHITHQGTGFFFIGNRIYHQMPRQAVILRGEQPHKLLNHSKVPYTRSVLCIGDRYQEKDERFSLLSLFNFSWIPKEGCHNLNLPIDVYVKLDELCNRIMKEKEVKSTGWERMVFSLVLEVAVLLERTVEADSSPGESDPVPLLIQQISDYIHGHFAEDLSLQRIAQQFSVSPEHLTRTFSKEMGISYYQFVLIQRIMESKRLLVQFPQMPVIEIALIVGFESPAHFSHTFRKMTDETPSQFRRKNVLRTEQD